MTDDAPGFAPLSSDDLDALLEGPDAASNLEAFFEKGYDQSMARFRDAIGTQTPWQKTQAPTAAFSLNDLVPPPKRKVAQPPTPKHVDAVSSDISIEEKESIEIPLRPIDKTPVQQVNATVKETPKQHDTGTIKETKKTTQASAPVTASSEPTPETTDSPELRKVSGELLEAKLKERQDKLGDVFKDKGTLS